MRAHVNKSLKQIRAAPYSEKKKKKELMNSKSPGLALQPGASYKTSEGGRSPGPKADPGSEASGGSPGRKQPGPPPPDTGTVPGGLQALGSPEVPEMANLSPGSVFLEEGRLG